MKLFTGTLGALLLLTAFWFTNAQATETSWFMPENDMKIGLDDKFRNDMTEKQFNAIIDKVNRVYAPIVRRKFGILKINRLWKNNTVNANASRMLWIYNVNMYGGLARHRLVTDDGFALVVCHELGHHLGGAPKVGNIMMKWASNEGQSDYWGALKCFKKVFGADDNIAIMAEREVEPTVTQKCSNTYGNSEDIALCQRASMAGYSLAQLLGGSQSSVNFNTPDRGVVSRTNDRHPRAQCRLDTYFAGALCDKPHSENVSNRNPNKGVCSRKEGHKDGVRSLCWYKP
jgi:hypothetical protein